MANVLCYSVHRQTSCSQGHHWAQNLPQRTMPPRTLRSSLELWIFQVLMNGPLLGGCLFVVTQCQNTLPIQACHFCCLQQSLCCPQNPTPFKQAVAGAQGQHQDCKVRQYCFTNIVNWLLLAALNVIWAAYESPPLAAEDQVSNKTLCFWGRM